MGTTTTSKTNAAADDDGVYMHPMLSNPASVESGGPSFGPICEGSSSGRGLGARQQVSASSVVWRQRGPPMRWPCASPLSVITCQLLAGAHTHATTWFPKPLLPLLTVAVL